ncbi:hypothetical protein OBE_07091, partial [human gut metagenome]
QVYAAAVTAQPRHTAVGGGKVHRKAVQRVGHSDVCGGKRGAGIEIVLVNGGQPIYYYLISVE